MIRAIRTAAYERSSDQSIRLSSPEICAEEQHQTESGCQGDDRDPDQGMTESRPSDPFADDERHHHVEPKQRGDGDDRNDDDLSQLHGR